MRPTDATKLAYSSNQPSGERAIVFLGVLIAHGALLLLWKPHPHPASEDGTSMVMLSGVAGRTVSPDREELQVRLAIPDREAFTILEPTPPDFPDQDTDAPLPSAIDWDAQAVLSISARIAADNERNRQASALIARKPVSVVALPPVADLGLSWQGPPPPRRVETLPEGGIQIRLGERCVLVLSPLPFIACNFSAGK